MIKLLVWIKATMIDLMSYLVAFFNDSINAEAELMAVLHNPNKTFKDKARAYFKHLVSGLPIHTKVEEV